MDVGAINAKKLAAALVRLLITDSELRDRLRIASPCDPILYHRGFLALDRDPDRSRLPERDRAELGRVARRAFDAWRDGTADLVQKRHGPNDFSYFLMVRRPPGAAEIIAAGDDGRPSNGGGAR